MLTQISVTPAAGLWLISNLPNMSCIDLFVSCARSSPFLYLSPSVHIDTATVLSEVRGNMEVITGSTASTLCAQFFLILGGDVSVVLHMVTEA